MTFKKALAYDIKPLTFCQIPAEYRKQTSKNKTR